MSVAQLTNGAYNTFKIATDRDMELSSPHMHQTGILMVQATSLCL